MDLLLNLYGSLLLLFGGFVLSIFTILISIFQEGIVLLSGKLKNEEKQAEENLRSQVVEEKKSKSLDIPLLRQNIAGLKKTRRDARFQLMLLDPLKMLSLNFLPLGLAFSLLFLVVFLRENFLWAPDYIIALPFIVSLFLFFTEVYIFWLTISTLLQASSLTQVQKKTEDDKMLAALNQIVDNTKLGKDSLYIGKADIKVNLDKKTLTPSFLKSFSVNKEHSLEFSVTNSSEMMLKNWELGLEFPKDVIIEETSNIESIYAGEKTKIVRFEGDKIQSHERNLQGKMKVKFLNKGPYKVRAFIKGENLKVKTINFQLEAVA